MRQAALFLAFLLLLSPAPAQNLNGSISGAVKDSSGAVVPGASITITNVDTNALAWKGSSGPNGIYIAPELPVGSYDIAVEAPGFRKLEIHAFQLKVDQRAGIDAVLEPGAVKETVTVTGESLAHLDRESTTLGLDVDPSQIRDVPLANRDIFNLLNLSAGVSAGGDATNINATQYSINGSRTQSSEITVDGVSSVSGGTGSPNYMPPIEAIREVKILTSTYPAEYGRTTGATISMVVDSGTNRYHGALYEYFRNEDLDANNFFNNLRGTQRPADRQNQFGAKLGGPVWLPKLYRGRDRTFFFINYAGTRQTVPATNVSTVPDNQFRGGDFSSSPVAIGDPLTSARTPFPGNKIPASRLDPAALKILSVIPAANSPGSFDPSTGRSSNSYVYTNATRPASDDITTRGDHNISNSHRMFLRLTHLSGYSPSATVVQGPFDPGNGVRYSSIYNTSAGLTSTLTPTTILDLRGSFERSSAQSLAPSQGIDPASVLGIQRNPAAAAPQLGDVNLNLSAGKRFPIGERFSLQLRAEAYNALNHTNLLLPGSTLSVVANTATQTAAFTSSGYGLITSARSARFMQMTARFEF